MGDVQGMWNANKHLLKINCTAGHHARKQSVNADSIFVVSEVNDNHNQEQYSDDKCCSVV